MLTVGTDSYITAEYADEYIEGHYRAGSSQRERWEALGEEEKDSFLKAACEELERVKWHGRAVSRDQPLSFPRLPYQDRTAEEAPERIKKAQAELALWLSDEQGQEDLQQREQIRLQGIKSVNLGSLAMTFADGARSELALVCPAAVRLITPYLNGGYDTE
ncbi:MAG: hypothetical protein K2N36_01185 [Ruminiclostridium sp.]|nr:hypothetical protein [Ruminiclostridium sp.]